MIFAAEFESQRSGYGAESRPKEEVRRQFRCLLFNTARNWPFAMLLPRFCFRIVVYEVLRQGKYFLSQGESKQYLWD